MLHFQHSSLIDAPVTTVWQFHDREDILQLLTPPWQPVQVIRREGGLGVGAITELRLFIGLLPVQWLARHTACEINRLFVDEQETGPMASWIHRHEFAEENRQTRLTDNISFALPGGEFAETLFGWLILAQLEAMFRYRHHITKRECEAI